MPQVASDPVLQRPRVLSCFPAARERSPASRPVRSKRCSTGRPRRRVPQVRIARAVLARPSRAIARCRPMTLPSLAPKRRLRPIPAKARAPRPTSSPQTSQTFRKPRMDNLPKPASLSWTRLWPPAKLPRRPSWISPPLFEAVTVDASGDAEPETTEKPAGTEDRTVDGAMTGRGSGRRKNHRHRPYGPSSRSRPRLGPCPGPSSSSSIGS